MQIFKYIKAHTFFPKYCPNIKRFHHKINRKDGRGNAVSFSPEEIKQIKQGIKELQKSI